jgi:TolB protein
MAGARYRWFVAALPLAAAIALLIALGSDEDKSPTAPTTTAEEPTSRSEYSDIYVLDVKTRKVDQLTSNEDEQFADFPSWSKSGRLIFSQAECEGCAAKLFVTDASGSKRTKIRSDVVNSFQPAWSPNERRIAVSKPGEGIFVIDARDGSAHRLSRGAADEAPAWSPDGKKILFHRQVTPTNWDIYETSPGGGPLERLTRDGRQQLHPAWSPDGRKIAFAEEARNGNWVIYNMNPDGSGRRQITDSGDSSQDPSWSPDGSRIAFVTQISGRESVATISLDGTGRTTLTGPTLAVTAPSWSPDGRKIAFAAKHVGPGFSH